MKLKQLDPLEELDQIRKEPENLRERNLTYLFIGIAIILVIAFASMCFTMFGCICCWCKKRKKNNKQFHHYYHGRKADMDVKPAAVNANTMSQSRVVDANTSYNFTDYSNYVYKPKLPISAPPRRPPPVTPYQAPGHGRTARRGRGVVTLKTRPPPPPPARYSYAQQAPDYGWRRSFHHPPPPRRHYWNSYTVREDDHDHFGNITQDPHLNSSLDTSALNTTTYDPLQMSFISRDGGD